MRMGGVEGCILRAELASTKNATHHDRPRAQEAVAAACLQEVLGIIAKLPGGYQRDLQLIKVPLFRAIDLAGQTLAILPAALAGIRFRPDRIRLDPAIHAAEEANRLAVAEGIPFREAYRRIAARLKPG